MKICYMCNKEILDTSGYGRIRRFITNREVCDRCYMKVTKFVNDAHNKDEHRTSNFE